MSVIPAQTAGGNPDAVIPAQAGTQSRSIPAQAGIPRVLSTPTGFPPARE